MERDLIFISHVTPKNNYQATWLETKLTLLGYNVWLDIKDLRGGDSFWPEIQKKIKNHSLKYLPIVTKDYIERANTPKTGVRKEVSCADGVKEVDKFIIPLRFDESPHSDFPIEFQELNGFDFSKNWADGLKALVRELEKCQIPKVQTGINHINKWFEALQIQNHVIDKKEKYYTNWLEFDLPKKIYAHEYQLVNEITLSSLGFPYIMEYKYIITFMDLKFLSANPRFEFKNTLEFDIELFTNNEDIVFSDLFVLVEPNKKLVKLLNLAFANFLKNQNLKFYTQSSNKEIFYFPNIDGGKKKISLKHYGRSNKAISGNRTVSWYYAISASARLYPFNFFRISHHLYFEKNGKKLNKEGQQEYRRSVAKEWYNKDWMDMLLAFFTKLKNSDSANEILIPLSTQNHLKINCEPFMLTSSYGYNEPNSVELDEETEEITQTAEEINGN